MTQEDKELLLKDLCARLPYRVKLQSVHNIDLIVKLYSIDLDDDCHEIKYYTYEGKALTICDASKLLRCGKFLRYKPYLFPLSSMTEEQEKEYHELIGGMFGTSVLINFKALEDFFNRNHFDYRGLIPLGLAIDATGLNIY